MMQFSRGIWGLLGSNMGNCGDDVGMVFFCRRSDGRPSRFGRIFSAFAADADV